MHYPLFKHVIYNLKRLYGTPGDYYHIVSTTDSMTTGRSTPVKAVYRARRMTRLSVEVVRDIKIGGSSFPGAQEVDVSAIFVLVDRTDLPNDFEWHQDDYIVLHKVVRRRPRISERFNIQKVERLEDDHHLLITARFIEGTPLSLIHEPVVRETFLMAETSNAEVL